MSRPIEEIIAHLRLVCASSIHTTLIQTEDILALCDAAEATPQTETGDANDIEHEYRSALLEFRHRAIRNTPLDPIEAAQSQLEYERAAARFYAAQDALRALLTPASSTPAPLP